MAIVLPDFDGLLSFYMTQQAGVHRLKTIRQTLECLTAGEETENEVIAQNLIKADNSCLYSLHSLCLLR
jgi:hypothetical protein